MLGRKEQFISIILNSFSFTHKIIHINKINYEKTIKTPSPLLSAEYFDGKNTPCVVLF